jgi:hypothetical protein
MAAGDGDAVCGEGPAPPAVTSLQSLFEDGLHQRSKPAFVMVAKDNSKSHDRPFLNCIFDDSP